jgi:hypothetical protein
MPASWMFTESGFNHVLNFENYHLILFLVALIIPYSFKEWKKVFLLMAIFTIGHLLALLLSAFGVVIIKMTLVDFLVPITLIIAALFNLVMMRKSVKGMHINIVGFLTLFFGIIHGLAFSDYYKSLLTGKQSDKIVSLLQFALGIETALILIVLLILIVTYGIYTFVRSSRRDVILVLSAFIIGVALPEIMVNPIWK